MAIDAIILDIGDVICEWNPDKLVAGVFDDASLHQQALHDTVGHPDWLDLDRGAITLNDAIANAQQRSALDSQKIAQLYHDTPKSLAPLPETIEAIAVASEASMPLYVLSNMHQHSWSYLERTFEFWSMFDGVVVSCACGLIKPDPLIFQHVVEKFGLNPATSVFVDDMAANIAAAKEFGLQGVHMTDRTSGGRIIKELLASRYSS